MMMRGVQVELPDAAKSRLDQLGIMRDEALDAARSAQNRINMLPQDATQMQAKLIVERDKHTQRNNHLHRLLSATNQWMFQLRLAPGYVLVPVRPDVKLKPGETAADAIENIRSQIAVIGVQIAAARSAPLKQSSRKDAVAEHLARLALRVRPKLGFDAKGNAKTLWAEDMVVNKDEVLGLICWALGPLGPEELTSAFLIEQEPDPEGALSPAERDAAVSKLSDDLLALERVEAALLDRADGSVLPRPEMNPIAYLQVQVVAQEVQAAVA
jgi:hypothetical protein